MGLFWDLMQQAQIDKHRQATLSLEERVAYLEEELTNTRELLYKTLAVLEEHTGTDIDGDGRIGK